MRILFLQFPLHSGRGGAEQHTLMTAQQLAAEGHQVFLLSSNKFLLQLFRNHNLDCRYVWCGFEPTSPATLLLFPFTILLTILILGYYLFFLRPFVIICLSLTEKIALGVVSVAGLKTLWVEHTRLGNWIKFSPLRPFYVFFSHWVKIISPSYYLRNQIIALGVPIEKVTVAYPGTVQPVAAFPTNPTSAELKNEVCTLGCLGRLTEEKGVEILLYALAELPKKFQLRIAGEGPQKDALGLLCRKLGLQNRVFFEGWVYDISNFFKQIEVLVMPSVQAETFGLVVIEAMARQIPVIASKVGALPEIIEHKKTGLLFKPGDTHDLIKSIDYLFESGQKNLLVALAYKSYQSRFTQTHMFRVILPLITGKV